MTKRRNLAALQRQCDEFNSACPVGHPVTVRKDAGQTVDTVVKHAAEILSGHSAVVWLEGISGCYLLDRVSARTQEPNPC